MSIVIPIVSEFSDAGIKSAKAGFSNFKTSIQNAEGAMGKFKAGSGAAMDYVRANAGMLAIAGGGALAGFAAKAIAAFQELALGAGKFSDATGLAVEDASRWIEVAGDIGIEAGTIQAGIGKMNKVLGTSPEIFKALGVEVAKTKQRTTDVNETFLNVIDRLNGIKDPAERARVATQLLGKGWQDMSELIAAGSEDLRASLQEVSDAKVVTQEELERSRKFRENLDNLKDKAEDLALTIGGPLVTGLNTALGDPILAKIDEFYQRTKDTKDEMLYFRDAAHEAMKAVVMGGDKATISLEQLQFQWDTLKADISGDTALRNLELQLINLRESAKKAFGGTRADVLNYLNDVDRAKSSTADLAAAVTDPKLQQKLFLAVDTGDLEKAWGLLQLINGQLGPSITPAGLQGKLGRMRDAQSAPITVNVNSADPNAVVTALQNYNRNVGTIPASTRP